MFPILMLQEKRAAGLPLRNHGPKQISLIITENWIYEFSEPICKRSSRRTNTSPYSTKSTWLFKQETFRGIFPENHEKMAKQGFKKVSFIKINHRDLNCHFVFKWRVETRAQIIVKKKPIRLMLTWFCSASRGPNKISSDFPWDLFCRKIGDGKQCASHAQSSRKREKTVGFSLKVPLLGFDRFY